MGWMFKIGRFEINQKKSDNSLNFGVSSHTRYLSKYGCEVLIGKLLMPSQKVENNNKIILQGLPGLQSTIFCSPKILRVKLPSPQLTK